MKKRLYLCRHGQTEFNVKGITQGRVDSPLTDLGISQAKALKKYIDDNHITYDHLYTSPLKRTKQTAYIVTNDYGKEVEGLIELDFGDLDGKDYKLCKPYNDDYTSINGESVRQVGDRMYDTLKSIMDKEDNQNVLIIAHGTCGRSFYYKVIGEYIKDFRIPNCGMVIYDYEDGVFEFVKMIDPLKGK